MPEIAGNPRFYRFAVAENPNKEHRDKYGIILVDDKDGVSPIGSQEFTSAEQAEQKFRQVLGALMNDKTTGTWG